MNVRGERRREEIEREEIKIGRNKGEKEKGSNGREDARCHGF